MKTKIAVAAILILLVLPSMGLCRSGYHHYDRHYYPRYHYYDRHYYPRHHHGGDALAWGIAGVVAGSLIAGAAQTPPPPQVVYVQPQTVPPIQTTPIECGPGERLLQRQVQLSNGQWVFEYGCFRY